MADFVFVLALLMQVTVLLVRGHTIARVIERMLVCGVISGVAVQTLDLLGLDLHQNLISAIGTVVLVMFTVREFGTEPTKVVKISRKPLLFLLPSVLVGTLVVVSRLMADGQKSGSLSNINFIRGEDDAKWLNVISQLLSGNHVVVGNVGGVCVSFLSGVVSFARTLFPLFSLSTNEVSLVIDCLIVAQFLLVLALPLVIMSVYRSEMALNEIWAILPIHTVVSLFLMSASSQFMSVGHLSAQLVLVFGLSAAVHYVSPVDDHIGQSDDRKTVGLVLVLGVTTSWLPLQVLSIVPSVFLGVFVTKAMITRRVSARNFHWIGASLVLTVGGLLVARNTMIYLSSNKNTITNLLSATGATQVHTTLVIFLAMASIVLAAVFVPRAGPQSVSSAVWLVVTIAAVLMVFVMADYVRTGKSNYGTQKLIYLTLTVIVGALLIPGVISLIGRTSSDVRTGALLAFSSALALGLVMDGSLLPWLELVKTSQWHSTASVADSPWARFTLSTDDSELTLETIPVACAIKKADSRVPALDWTTYACTRFLTSIAGLESSAGPLVEWQLRNDWEKSKGYLLELPDEILDRNLIFIDESSKFVGLAPIRSILED